PITELGTANDSTKKCRRGGGEPRRPCKKVRQPGEGVRLPLCPVRRGTSLRRTRRNIADTRYVVHQDGYSRAGRLRLRNISVTWSCRHEMAAAIADTAP